MYNILYGQIEIEWNQTFGGELRDQGGYIIETDKGNYLVVGSITCKDGQPANGKGNMDFWVLKLNKEGELLSDIKYGGTNNDGGKMVLPSKNGYLFLGSSKSSDMDLNTNKGDADIWVFETDLKGDLLWSQTYGGNSSDYGAHIGYLPDSSLIVLGATNSEDGDVNNIKGWTDYWLLKLGNQGNLIWEKTYGNEHFNRGSDMHILPNGDFIMIGFSEPDNHNPHPNKNFDRYYSNENIEIVKMTENAEKIWTQNYGGSSTENTHQILAMPNGDFMVLGSSSSYNGDKSKPKGNFDIWILKINASGELLWERSYGGSKMELARSGVLTNDNSIIIVGSAESNDKDVSINKGNFDLWMIKIDQHGDIVWEKTIGGSKRDIGLHITSLSDGSYLVVGESGSDDGDLPSNKGDWDLWVFKFRETDQ